LDTLSLLNTVAASLLVLTLAALLLRGVMRSGPVTPNRIVGAVAVYLLIALFFVMLFDLLDRVAPGAFTLEPEPLPTTPAGARFFYLSVITLTSLGLGSVAPPAPARPRAGDGRGGRRSVLHDRAHGPPRLARGRAPALK
jgi:hypothetical protein